VLCFLASSILVYIAIARFITGPIIEMERTADTMASGDLTSELKVTGHDEVSALQKAINRMAFNLKDMLSKVSHITSSVTAVTSNIALSSRECFPLLMCSRRLLMRLHPQWEDGQRNV